MIKKILILGGASMHCKLVREAKEMGLYTIVTDYLKDSPAKQIADESWTIDVMNVVEVVEKCKSENIKAVLSTHLDPCQRSYYEICHRLDIPCYIDSWEQVSTLTNKNKFKAACIRNGVDIIPSFREDEINSIEYPVLVKPAHSRGSRGQTVCLESSQIMDAIIKAKHESGDNNAIIEKYMGSSGDFSMTYMYIKNKPYLVRTSDRYLGPSELGLERIGIGTVSPSRYTELYIEKAEPAVLKMLSELKIRNGPVFMQGFVDGDKVRFYDPGYRFPGSEYDDMFAKITSINLIKLMIEFAMTGEIDNKYNNLYDGVVDLKGHFATILQPLIKEGIIKDFTDLGKIDNISYVHGHTQRHDIGDQVMLSRDVNQRCCEIDIITSCFSELKTTCAEIFRRLHVTDTEGKEMLYGSIKIKEIDGFKNIRNGLELSINY